MSDTLHLVCPHCATTNRVPAARLQDGANCGQCKRPLFDGQPVELTAETFQRQISRSDIPVVVDFWASWCGPCQMMAPVFSKATQQLEPQVRMAKVNTENEQWLAQQYHIRSIPTLAIFKGGREIARQAGAMNEAQLIGWIRSQLQE